MCLWRVFSRLSVMYLRVTLQSRAIHSKMPPPNSKLHQAAARLHRKTLLTLRLIESLSDSPRDPLIRALTELSSVVQVSLDEFRSLVQNPYAGPEAAMERDAASGVIERRSTLQHLVDTCQSRLTTGPQETPEDEVPDDASSSSGGEESDEGMRSEQPTAVYPWTPDESMPSEQPTAEYPWRWFLQNHNGAGTQGRCRSYNHYNHCSQRKVTACPPVRNWTSRSLEKGGAQGTVWAEGEYTQPPIRAKRGLQYQDEQQLTSAKKARQLKEDDVQLGN
eukprot:TRINITY_DN24563_c0_g1_i1.p1 TRINITY_DN24563_c0_g1~~TRINITY_DN24563_c0_g1_i1.p1  ORF type:complete len:277 (+),score=15.24 TRINITY_DN24563_c0_g1_i1:175-1005(+)